MKNKSSVLNTGEIITRLAAKYSSPNFGFLTQVRNGTGYMSNRTADALAMSLWPSRGLHVYGFEVKASRTDWIKELNTPDKAEAMAMYCHYWYLVVGDEEIVKDEELPKTWGLLVPSGKGLRIKKEAEFKKDALQFDALMLAGIFRNVADHCVPKEIVDIKVKQAVESETGFFKKQADEHKIKISEINGRIYDFENATGLRFSTWGDENNKELIKNIKLAQKGGKQIEVISEKLAELKGIGDRISKYIEGELGDYQI